MWQRQASSCSMPETVPYVAFFDLDDTLLADNSGKVFWDYCVQHKIYTPLQMGFLGMSLFMYLTGFDETEDFIRNWAKCFKGWQTSKMEHVTRELFDLKIRDLIRPQAREAVAYHKSKGAETVILSASTRYVCEPVKDHLGMHAAICTPLDVENGQFNGHLGGPYVFGEQKHLSALDYCANKGIDIAGCYYYGDAYTDRFVMEAVGTPVCVTPDKKLRAHAAEKDWQIVEW